MERIVLNGLPLDKEVEGVILLESITQGTTKQNTPFLSLVLSDGKDKVEAKLWNHSKESFSISENSLIGVKLYAKMYNDIKSFEVMKYTKMPENCGYAVEDFITKVPYKPEEMYHYILKVMDSAIPKDDHCPPLFRLTHYLYDTNKEKLLYWSAAEKVHHNLYGGLLYHTFRMMRLATVMTKVYPMVNKQLLYGAVALHDIGKLEEIDTSVLGTSKFTIVGSLLGHTALGLKMIDKAAAELGICDSAILDVQHCIAAHHGKPEFGAITKPATIEAFVLHEIDKIDSRIYQFEEVYKSIEPGELSDRIFGLDNIRVFHSSTFHAAG